MSAPNASARFQLARPVGVVEDQRVQIAVAGMEHVGDPQAVCGATSRAMRFSTCGSWRRGIVPSMQ